MSILPDTTSRTKQPRNAERPFPWRCGHCGKVSVVPTTIEYTAQIRQGGQVHSLVIPQLQIPVCGACGEKVFTEEVDRQIDSAFHLALLAPP